jgi:hypothetical protein
VNNSVKSNPARAPSARDARRADASSIRSIGGIRNTDARWLQVPVPVLMMFCDVKKNVVKRNDSITPSRRNVRNRK